MAKKTRRGKWVISNYKNNKNWWLRFVSPNGRNIVERISPFTTKNTALEAVRTIIRGMHLSEWDCYINVEVRYDDILKERWMVTAESAEKVNQNLDAPCVSPFGIKR